MPIVVINRTCLPNILSLCRVPIGILIVISISYQWYALGLTWFLAAILTDIFDGKLARRIGTACRRGAFIDASADFILILLCTGGLIWKGIFPWWLAILEVNIFSQFLLTSRNVEKMYDPLGKHIGTVLMGGICVVMIVSMADVGKIVTLVFLSYFVMGILSRILHFYYHK